MGHIYLYLIKIFTKTFPNISQLLMN